MFDYLGRKNKRESEKILQRYELKRIEKFELAMQLNKELSDI